MNWKKALKTFRKYEHSNMHKEATIKLASKARGVGIDAQLSDDPIEGKDPKGSMMVQALTHMKLQKTGTATCTLK